MIHFTMVDQPWSTDVSGKGCAMLWRCCVMWRWTSGTKNVRRSDEMEECDEMIGKYHASTTGGSPTEIFDASLKETLLGYVIFP